MTFGVCVKKRGFSEANACGCGWLFVGASHLFWTDPLPLPSPQHAQAMDEDELMIISPVKGRTAPQQQAPATAEVR